MTKEQDLAYQFAAVTVIEGLPSVCRARGLHDETQRLRIERERLSRQRLPALVRRRSYAQIAGRLVRIQRECQRLREQARGEIIPALAWVSSQTGEA